MKKITLIYLTFFVTLTINAQTDTYFIDWSFNSTPTAEGDANSSRTIEVGDTVTWVWYANGFHNVVSASDATESFDSGGLEGPGFEFSHTFTEVGTNDYVCTPHSGNMFGTITVVPDGSLNTDEFAALENLRIYPNPTSDFLNVALGSNITSSLNFNIYNVLGQKVKNINTGSETDISINVSDLERGLYVLKVEGNNSSISKRFIVK